MDDEIISDHESDSSHAAPRPLPAFAQRSLAQLARRERLGVATCTSDEESDTNDEESDANDEESDEEIPESPAKQLKTNYKNLKRADLPDIYQITERPNIEALEAFAASPQATRCNDDCERDVNKIEENDLEITASQQQKKESTSELTLREITNKYLKNIDRKNEVIISYRQCVVGHILTQEGCVKASRVYPFSEMSYPYSITHLPKVIRNVALKHWVSNDDKAAFHRIIQGLIKNKDAKKMSMEIINDARKVYKDILHAGHFKQWVNDTHIKEAIHATCNGQSIAATKRKLGDVGNWIKKAAKLLGEQTTEEICSSEEAKRALKLLKKHAKYKKKLVYEEIVDGETVQLKDPKFQKVERNLKLTLRSFKCQEPEALGLQAKMQFFKRKDIMCGPPIHDDVSCSLEDVYANYKHKLDEKDQGKELDELIDESENSFDKMLKALSDDLTRSIKSSVKNYQYVQVNSKLVEPPYYQVGVKTDLAAAQLVYENYPHWKYCQGKLYVFNDDLGVWTDDDTTCRKTITKFQESLYKYEVFGTGKKKSEALSCTESYGSNLTLINKVPPLIKTLCLDNDWMQTMEASSLGKLLFNNGYYDADKDEFFDKEIAGFNPDIMFFGRIKRDFPDLKKYMFEYRAADSEYNYMKSVQKRLFNDTLGDDVGNWFCTCLSIGLMGDCGRAQFRRFIAALGTTNTGKTTLTKALSLSCGDYVAGFDAANISIKKNQNNDAAQAMRWYMALRWKRIIFSSELDPKTDIDGVMIKRLASGGDSLTGRHHYGNETPFTPHSLPVLLANDFSNVKPWDSAIDARLRFATYTKSFVEGVPQNDDELQMDKNLDNEMNTIKFQDAFVALMIHTYQDYKIKETAQKGYFESGEPAAVKEAKQQWVNEDSLRGVIGRFCDTFEISNKTNHYVTNSDLQDWLNRNGGREYSLQKLKTEISTVAKRQFKGQDLNLKTISKWIEGKTQRALQGVRHKPPCPSFDLLEEKLEAVQYVLVDTQDEYETGIANENMSYKPKFKVAFTESLCQPITLEDLLERIN